MLFRSRIHSHGAERSSEFCALHAGAFLKPSAAYSLPWVSSDTLQSPTLTGLKRQRQLAIRTEAMGNLCLAIDSVLNTRGQRALKAHDPKALSRSRQLHNTIQSQSQNMIDHGGIQSLPLPATQLQIMTKILRFGNLGTCVAIGRGQSEKLHLDLNDYNAHCIPASWCLTIRPDRETTAITKAPCTSQHLGS